MWNKIKKKKTVFNHLQNTCFWIRYKRLCPKENDNSLWGIQEWNWCSILYPRVVYEVYWFYLHTVFLRWKYSSLSFLISFLTFLLTFFLWLLVIVTTLSSFFQMGCGCFLVVYWWFVPYEIFPRHNEETAVGLPSVLRFLQRDWRLNQRWSWMWYRLY